MIFEGGPTKISRINNILKYVYNGIQVLDKGRMLLMKIGVVYPQTEYGSDPVAIRDYAQTVEELGYSHVAAYDHVLGANPDRPGGWQGPYTYRNPFHEPFVLFGFMAGVTRAIGFLTAIIILPQRQTALVAKQAATLDVLSGGQFRLGVGLGWNEIEFTSLNQEFHNRGRRSEEQVELLRRLWTEPLVTFQGRWHTIPDVGIAPLPVQQPIPVWFGGHSEGQLKRAAKLGQGWMPNYRSAIEAKPAIELLNRFLAEAGRSWTDFGLEGRIPYGDGNPELWRQLMEGWRAVGATHIQVNTMGVGYRTPQEHLTALRHFAKEMGINHSASS
jgi:probable F420-dependent oxidoreductase